ncbi:hypothetical protein HDV57DRAFT_163268 [Trichoderma longibrachiatum]|uniref:Uncharacterized protein n=1 Tax=Trichoderma longibrachiatum ATCC 18648 TaxID=983965 RepID=A0A2T4C1F1_TRILO|nr:hypothetical protein M440DRAFT_1273989 [Trichoderma longibrachiatum ATCC 18648]
MNATPLSVSQHMSRMTVSHHSTISKSHHAHNLDHFSSLNQPVIFTLTRPQTIATNRCHLLHSLIDSLPQLRTTPGRVRRSMLIITSLANRHGHTHHCMSHMLVLITRMRLFVHQRP